jgi:hypothetical protein
MQLHNPSLLETLFAYNRWRSAGNVDLGIGNSPAGNPDWTFQQNSASYTIRNLYIFVSPAPEPGRSLLLAAGLALTCARRYRGAR